ncbi:MAG: hypothetical protein ACE5FP_04785 [Gemmatimonadota bacterium]
MWLSAASGVDASAPAASVTDEARQPFWRDLSGAGNHAYVIDRPPGAPRPADGSEPDRRPQSVQSSDGGRVLRFDGRDDLLGLTDAEGLNLGGPWAERTIALAFRTSADVDRRQMIFETGGDLRGFNVYLDAGRLHMSAYDLWNDDGGRTTPFGPLDVTAPVSPGTAYAVVMELDQPTGRIRGWVNDVLVGELTGAGRVFQHHEDTGIGAINEDTYYHDGVRQGVPAADFFAGEIAQILIYNRVLTDAERAALWPAVR